MVALRPTTLASNIIEKTFLKEYWRTVCAITSIALYSHPSRLTEIGVMPNANPHGLLYLYYVCILKVWLRLIIFTSPEIEQNITEPTSGSTWWFHCLFENYNSYQRCQMWTKTILKIRHFYSNNKTVNMLKNTVAYIENFFLGKHGVIYLLMLYGKL